MNKTYPILMALFLTCFGFPGLLLAQDEDTDTAANDAADESSEAGEEGDAVDTEAAPEETEEEDTAETEGEGSEESAIEADETAIDETVEEDVEPLVLEEKKPELDLSALGEIDPEAELTGGAITEDDATEEVTDDWTERAMDLLELHGYFRVRPGLAEDFNIRNDSAIYNRTAVNETDAEDDTFGYCGGENVRCKNSTLAGANMRFRLEPTINISEEVWIKSQIDFLDNVMLGSTPRYYQNFNSPYAATTVNTSSVQGFNMGAPDSSQMMLVRRAWGEVMTPFGQVRFGRMGDHWGLGMLHNAGNGLFNDFGDSVDRIMFATKINDWIIAPAFDFPNEGVAGVDASGRPFDLGQLDDAFQLSAIVGYKHDAEDQEKILKRGDWLINSGLYFTYRWQALSFETNPDEEGTISEGEMHFYNRDLWVMTPDLWFQFLVGTFRLEFELALIYGRLSNPDQAQWDFEDASPLELVQWGGVLQAKYGLLDDDLHLGLEFAFASGDKDVDGLRAPTTYDQLNNPGDGSFTAFTFNPAYNTDMILYRHVLGSVSQTYYFKFWLDFGFLKNSGGRQMNLRLDALYSRAVYSATTIHGTNPNIGIELNVSALYKTEDNFFAGVQYGVLFPLAAFKGEPTWYDEGTSPFINDTDLAVPQSLQAILGITF